MLADIVGLDEQRRSNRYRCPCGADYALIPKEVPLAIDEAIFCKCGRMLKGTKYSTKYFDYEPVGSTMVG
jgi:hypothetical protein